MSDDNPVHDAGEGPDENVNRMVEWLRRQPARQIRWGDDHQTFTSQVRRASWVDVVVPEMCEELGMSWSWTIVGPEDDDAEETWPRERHWVLSVPPDCEVHAAFDPKQHWYAEDGPIAICEPGGTADPAELAQVVEHAAAIGGWVECVPSWHNDTLCRALEQWTSQLAGRPDLTFAFDSEMHSQTWHRLQGVDLDSMPTYDLGDGVHATDMGMDGLLGAGPEVAAQVMESLKRIVVASAGTGRAEAGRTEGRAPGHS